VTLRARDCPEGCNLWKRLALGVGRSFFDSGTAASLELHCSQVQYGDEVMFFFSGHGVQLGAANYLLPIDIGGEPEECQYRLLIVEWH